MGYITIPKSLMGPAYSGVSATAKFLYGLLADRSSLSKRNGWKTPNGEIFVYFPIAEICKTLGCGHDKARQLLRELVDAGLIRRIRQGQGKPDKIIVTDAIQVSENKHSSPRKQSSPDCDSAAGNNPDLVDPDSINPDQPISLNRAALEAMLHENISYDILVSQIGKTFVDTAVSVMLDAMCNPNPTMQIAGISRTQDEISQRIMDVNDMHVRYAFDRVRAMTDEIRSPRAYVLARLYHAPEEMDIYYTSRVLADEIRGWR